MQEYSHNGKERRWTFINTNRSMFPKNRRGTQINIMTTHKAFGGAHKIQIHGASMKDQVLHNMKQKEKVL